MAELARKVGQALSGRWRGVRRETALPRCHASPTTTSPEADAQHPMCLPAAPLTAALPPPRACHCTAAASHLPWRQRAAAAAAHFQAAGHAQRGGVAGRDSTARLARVPQLAAPGPDQGAGSSCVWVRKCCTATTLAADGTARAHNLRPPPRRRSSRGCAPKASTSCSACLSTTPPSASRCGLGRAGWHSRAGLLVVVLGSAARRCLSPIPCRCSCAAAAAGQGGDGAPLLQRLPGPRDWCAGGAGSCRPVAPDMCWPCRLHDQCSVTDLNPPTLTALQWRRWRTPAWQRRDAWRLSSCQPQQPAAAWPHNFAAWSQGDRGAAPAAAHQRTVSFWLKLLPAQCAG